MQEGSKVKTRKNLKFLIGSQMVTLPKGSKGVITEIAKGEKKRYKVKLYVYAVSAWLTEDEIETRLW